MPIMQKLSSLTSGIAYRRAMNVEDPEDINPTASGLRTAPVGVALGGAAGLGAAALLSRIRADGIPTGSPRAALAFGLVGGGLGFGGSAALGSMLARRHRRMQRDGEPFDPEAGRVQNTLYSAGLGLLSGAPVSPLLTTPLGHRIGRDQKPRYLRDKG